MINEHARKSTAVVLIIGATLSTLAMTLHPLGGSLQVISQVKQVMMTSHAIALFCIPVMAFGYWGFSAQLTDKYHLSRLALLIMLMGLMAVAISGTMNGLVLTQFAMKYQNWNSNDTALTTIVTYGHCISKAFAHVFIGNTLLAILIWSVMIIRTGKFPKWFGYYGLLIIAALIACFMLGITLTTVWGFTTFVFFVVSWNIAGGILLFISKTY